MKLEGQVALVTGASRGLGLEVARALGAGGASIGAIARAGSELDGAVAALGKSGVRAMAAAADVTSAAAVDAAVKQVAEQWLSLIHISEPTRPY